MKERNIVKELTNDELRDRLVEEKTNYTKMKMSHAVSPVENPLKLRSVRKLVARLKTEAKKRELANQTSK